MDDLPDLLQQALDVIRNRGLDVSPLRAWVREIIDAKRILDAHKDPFKYPDLVVRVTGFTAFFAMLSEKFRQLVVDRVKSVNPAAVSGGRSTPLC